MQLPEGQTARVASASETNIFIHLFTTNARLASHAVQSGVRLRSVEIFKALTSLPALTRSHGCMGASREEVRSASFP